MIHDFPFIDCSSEISKAQLRSSGQCVLSEVHQPSDKYVCPCANPLNALGILAIMCHICYTSQMISSSDQNLFKKAVFLLCRRLLHDKLFHYNVTQMSLLQSIVIKHEKQTCKTIKQFDIFTILKT